MPRFRDLLLRDFTPRHSSLGSGFQYRRNTQNRLSKQLMGLLLAVAWLMPGPARSGDDVLLKDIILRLQKVDPGVAVRVDSPTQLRISRDGEEVGFIDLSNLREICIKRVAEVCETQKLRLVATHRAQIARSRNNIVAPQSVRMIVRPAGYLRAIEAQLNDYARANSGSENLAQGLPMVGELGSGWVKAWAEDTPDAMIPISESRMKEAGFTIEDLDRLGSANLKLEIVSTLAKASEQYPAIFFSNGNDYLPSVLIDEDFWARVAGDFSTKDAKICLPSRHSLFVYIPELDSAPATNFDAICRTLARQAAPAFSEHVIHRVNQRWIFN